jgi:hypothetical protein
MGLNCRLQLLPLPLGVQFQFQLQGSGMQRSAVQTDRTEPIVASSQDLRVRFGVHRMYDTGEL